MNPEQEYQGYHSLRALHIQVAASREKVQIEGNVPAMISEGANLVTIAQTSGCSLSKSVALAGQGIEYVRFRRELV